MPSILKAKDSMQGADVVLNLVISGMPSIHYNTTTFTTKFP